MENSLKPLFAKKLGFGCMVLGSQALKATIDRLEQRIADYKTQTELAASTDFPAGE